MGGRRVPIGQRQIDRAAELAGRPEGVSVAELMQDLDSRWYPNIRDRLLKAEAEFGLVRMRLAFDEVRWFRHAEHAAAWAARRGPEREIERAAAAAARAERGLAAARDKRAKRAADRVARGLPAPKAGRPPGSRAPVRPKPHQALTIKRAAPDEQTAAERAIVIAAQPVITPQTVFTVCPSAAYERLGAGPRGLLRGAVGDAPLRRDGAEDFRALPSHGATRRQPPQAQEQPQ
jgi:hypothetical protein